jgi:anti-sigma28 factor (negative regulator of flagellin synthesis)
MKVYDPNIRGGSTYGPARTGEAEGIGQAGRKGRGWSAGSTDEVQLSSLARAVQMDATMREERISRLADAVDSGAYRVDARELSRRLVEEAFERPAA